MRKIIIYIVNTLWVGGSFAMTGLGMYYDISGSIATPLTWFGFPLWFWGLASLIVFCLVIIGQLRYTISKYENLKTEIEVSPCFPPVGKELTLVVHNKSNTRALVSATMAIKEYYGDINEGSFAIEPELINASMCWEATGNHEQWINADGRPNIKLCGFGEKLKNGVNVSYIIFTKMDGGKSKEVEFAQHTQNNVPKVVIKIRFDAEPPIKGKKEWSFLIEPTRKSLMIRPEARLISKSFIRKVLGLNKFKESIPE